MWLLARRLSRQGSERPEGAVMLAVSRLRSVSVMSREKSAAEPSFTWDRLCWSSTHTHTHIRRFYTAKYASLLPAMVHAFTLPEVNCLLELAP